MRSAPLPPYKPTAPVEEFETQKFEAFFSTVNSSDSYFKFSDVIFPKDVNLSDVIVMASTEYDYDENNIRVSMGVNVKQIIKNNAYASQLKLYTKQMKEYETQQAKYLKAKELWDDERRKFEEKQNDKKIQEAKKILKKLGYKVVKDDGE